MRFARGWADSSRPILQVSPVVRSKRAWRHRMAAVVVRSQRSRFRLAVELLRMRFCCKAPSVKRYHRIVQGAGGSARRAAARRGPAVLSREIQEDRVEDPVGAAAVVADLVVEVAGSAAAGAPDLAEGPAVAAEREEGEADWRARRSTGFASAFLIATRIRRWMPGRIRS